MITPKIISTIPGVDAGAEDCIQTPDPGSADQRFSVKHCAKRRNLKIFSASPPQIQRKLSITRTYVIHSIKSTLQRLAAVYG